METLTIVEGSKQEKYKNLLPQIEAVIDENIDVTANMSNVAAMLHYTFGFLWTGFYRVVGNKLVVGPYQGPLACSTIRFGKGVCGTAWQRAETVVVPDVDAFPGHIACSSMSRSEIVVPLIQDNKVVAVLDIDSEEPGTFDETDALYLQTIVEMLDY